MAASQLVVRVGDRVSVTGQLVRRAGGYWLDYAFISDLLFHPLDWVSPHSIELLGIADGAASGDLSEEAGARSGRTCVTGIWHGDTITVDGSYAGISLVALISQCLARIARRHRG